MYTGKAALGFYLGSILFICADILFIILHLTFISALLPLIALIFYWSLFFIDRLMLLVVFCTPLSINIYQVPGLGLGQIGIGVALPTEPIMVGIMLLFFLHYVYSWYDIKIFFHPVSMVILLSLLWMLVTCYTSTMRFVSFKYFIERMWGVVTFYFLGVMLFKKLKNIYYFNWLYIGSFVIVITYTLINHSHSHFTEKVAHVAVKPFYNDHTAYGAMLAMFIPVLGGFCFNRKLNITMRTLACLLFFIFLGALALSYSRAAWISVLAALLVLILIFFKIQFKWLLGIVCLGGILLFVFQDKVIFKLEQNRTDVSQNIKDEIQSISNISSDASNVERLNRWSCAYRMWLDKPIFGFGPGTYMFQYAPFQLSYMHTIISTNEANGGNAHNEYLGPLSEEGLLGMLLMLAIVIAVSALSFRLIYTLEDKEMRILTISIFLGLVTYFVHGMMNNFLDTDKAAVPFWGFIGMLVGIDYRNKKLESATASFHKLQ